MVKKVDNSVVIDDYAQKCFMERIKELRHERDLFANELAECLGCSRSAISMYETGKRQPDLNILTKYSEFFDVTIDYLVGKTDVRKPLYKVACFSNLADADIGKLSKGAQEDITRFIKYVMAEEEAKRKKK